MKYYLQVPTKVTAWQLKMVQSEPVSNGVTKKTPYFPLQTLFYQRSLCDSQHTATTPKTDPSEHTSSVSGTDSVSHLDTAKRDENNGNDTTRCIANVKCNEKVNHLSFPML